MEHANDLLTEEIPWARRFARSCAAKLPAYLDHDDLQSAGILGYLRAASRYERGKGASFRGFCAVRIRGAILDELRKWDWAPRSVHRNNKRITRITSMLVTQLDREPTGPELAAALGIDVSELVAMQSQSQSRQMLSLDDNGEAAFGDESISLSERLADPQAAAPDSAIRSDEDRRQLMRCLGSLPKSQATVLVLHYLQNVPLRDVADLLKVTPSRVSQLHHQALDRLRAAWDRAQKDA